MPTTTTEPVCPGKCWTCAERIARDIERGHWKEQYPGSPLLYNDRNGDPRFREYLDRNCNLVDINGRVLRPAAQQFGEGCEGNQLCPPDRVVHVPCPSPSPGPTPSPSAPPVPGDGPSASCPELVCIHVNVHNIMGPDFLPRDHPVIGGYVVLDSTPLFGACNAGGRCNAEQHWRCTRAQRDHVHAPPPGDPDGECTIYRHCEDDAGPCWEQTGGPFVERSVQAPGDNNRGYQVRLGPFREPGVYSFKAWGGTSGCPWRDGQGVPVGGAGEGAVSFEVR